MRQYLLLAFVCLFCIRVYASDTYVKTVWTESTPLNVTNLQKIENGIETISSTSAITSINICTGAVTAEKLATDAVETAKIKDAAVTGVKILDGAITNAKIGAGAVTPDKMSGNLGVASITEETLTGDVTINSSGWVTVIGGVNGVTHQCASTAINLLLINVSAEIYAHTAAAYVCLRIKILENEVYTTYYGLGNFNVENGKKIQVNLSRVHQTKGDSTPHRVWLQASYADVEIPFTLQTTSEEGGQSTNVQVCDYGVFGSGGE